MPQATIESISNHTITTLTADEIRNLADCLYCRAVSTLAVDNRQQRLDLVTASRALRRLLAAYERGTGRTISCLMLDGGV
jgi:hypothetical protein